LETLVPFDDPSGWWFGHPSTGHAVTNTMVVFWPL